MSVVFYCLWQSHLLINASLICRGFFFFSCTRFYAFGELLRTRGNCWRAGQICLGRLRCVDLKKRLQGIKEEYLGDVRGSDAPSVVLTRWGAGTWSWSGPDPDLILILILIRTHCRLICSEQSSNMSKTKNKSENKTEKALAAEKEQFGKQQVSN